MGEQPKWDEGSPTYIHSLVRKRMRNNFNIFLESNDKIVIVLTGLLGCISEPIPGHTRL